MRGLLAAGCWEAVELPPPLASQCNWGGGYAMAVLFAAGATLYWSEGHKGPVIERCRSTAVELAGEGGEVEVVRALMEADGRG